MIDIQQEHTLLRAFLQHLGSTYVYQEAPLDNRWSYTPVVRTTPRAAPQPRQAAPLTPPAGRPSALDFARQAAPNAPAGPPVALPASPAAIQIGLRELETAGVSSPSAYDAERLSGVTQSNKLQIPAAPSAAGFLNPAYHFADALSLMGHRLFQKDGKLFVTNASQLSDEDRTKIKAMRAALLQIAPEEDKKTSLVTFLGSPATERPAAWVAREPPILDGIDTIVLNFETDGLDWVHGHKPIGVTVGTLDGRIRQYLPYAHRGGGNLDEATVLRWLREQVRGKHIINANTRFDLHMGRVGGVDLEEQGCTVSDIQHTAALLDDHRKRFKLDELAQDLLPGGVMVPRVDESRMSDYHASDVARRAEYQVQLVAELRDVMYPMIDAQDLRTVHNLEDQFIFPLVEMEKNGALIDLELLESFSQQCHRMHDEILWEIAREVGFAFDHTPTSWRRLFDHYGLGISYLKSRKETYADGVIAAIDHPIIKRARFAGQLASLDSKIFKPYKSMIGADGILHFDIKQLRGEDGGTVSGRCSAGYIQQVPNLGNHRDTFGEINQREIYNRHELGPLLVDDLLLKDMFPRRLFIPAPGTQYLEADAAQIQYRIFAHHANNPQVLAGYAADPRASFHKMIMKKIVPYKPDLNYESLKSMNFMKIFGGGLIKIAVMMKFISEEEGEEIREARTQWSDPRLKQAREIKAIYDREMPEVEPLLRKSAHLAMSECDDYCRKTAESRLLHQLYEHRGYVKTVLGRRSRFPNNYRLHKAFCMVDQGSEGDIVKTKIVELHKARKQTGFLLRQTVHDSVGGDAQWPETLARVDAILNTQSFPQLKVPILWECATGANWAACKG